MFSRSHGAKRPRLVVHVGARKTATTYIQRAIGLNEKRLLAAGVYLPQVGRFDLNPGNISYHHLAFELQGSSRFNPELGGWDDLRTELAEARPDTVMISCEVFEAAITDDRCGELLLQQLKSISDDITMVLAVREWPAFINSMYNQAIKMFAISYSLDRYVDMNMETGATKFRELYAPFLEDESIRFVGIRYDDLKDPDPLTAILRAGGIDIDTSEFKLPPGLVNTSLGAIGLEITIMLGKFLNAQFDDWSWESRPVQELHIKNLVATDRRGWNQEAFWGWTTELWARHLPTIQADMNEFAQALWGHDWPGDLNAQRPQQISTFEHYPPDLLSDALEHIDDMLRLYVKLRGD